MNRLMLTVIAGCMSAALTGAYAADADKKAPTSVPEAGPAASGAPTTKGAPPAAARAPAAAGSASGMDDTKGPRTRRAARAEKG